MKVRLDKYLAEKKIVKSRAQAKLLIEEGSIFVNGHCEKRAGALVKFDDEIILNKEDIFVSRGAYKIEGAISSFSIDVSGLIVADVGASTGGFTDYLLKHGALKSYCIDVGHDQLAQELVNDERVFNLEGVSIKEPLELAELVNLAVVDLSYISLSKVLINILNLVEKDGLVIALVKPQFEVGKENVGKKGIVKSKKAHLMALKNLMSWCTEHDIFIRDIIVSPIHGKGGNKEFLILIDKSMNEQLPLEDKLAQVVMEN